MQSDRYVLRGGEAGRARLRLLAEVMGGTTRELFGVAGLPAGGHCLDLGCGGGDVSADLARAVGPHGTVLGVDVDAAKIAIAADEAATAGVPGLRFEVRDVLTWEPGTSFDVIYARFLLTHLPQPAALVQRIVRWLRPGGVLVVEDIDFRGHGCDPPSEAVQQYVRYYTASVARRGGDAEIGPRIPAMLRAAGCTEVGTRTVHPAATSGGIKALTRVTLASIATAVIGDGLASAEELAGTTAALDRVIDDPAVLLRGPFVVQTWGRAARLRAAMTVGG